MSYLDEVKDGVNQKVASFHLRRKFFWLIGIVLFLGIAYTAVILYYPYSQGTRTGFVRKMSNKGFVFKTWEGELQMPGNFAYTNEGQVSTGGNIWQFSVLDGKDDVVKALQDAEATGRRVTLHYTERLRQFDWRGDTRYFIDKVTQAPQ